MNKIWKLKNHIPENGKDHSQEYESFVNELNSLKAKIRLPDVFSRLLFLRGVKDYSGMVKYFKPNIDQLHDPFLMKDCDIACDRIINAIDNKEQIMVLGDYDVDGACGASMFYLFMKNFDIESEVYIPDRIKEGYGISIKSIDDAKAKGIKLIVAIDCGITALDKVKYANEQGIQFIICDHHQPPESIPEALAVLDPLREDCDYPFDYLCGTGVAFKLIQAVCIKKGIPDYAFNFLDFVAIATSSDIAPLFDENRVLVSLGFKMISENPRTSIKALMDVVGLDRKDISTISIVFSIAPRINAVGRLGDAKRAFDLLVSENGKVVEDLADRLNQENDERRTIDKLITDDAFKIFKDSNDDERKYSIVLHKDDWHPGVIGIVAARLVEKYNLPTVVLTTVNGVAKGSARSINEFNIYEALKKCENKLIQFGGHCHAAGLEIALENIDDFKSYFEKLAKEDLSILNAIPEVIIDSEITFKEIDSMFLNIYSYLEPFGPGNSLPIFRTDNLEVTTSPKVLKNNTHIFRLTEIESRVFFDAIFPGSPEIHDDLVKGALCNACYTIDLFEKNGGRIAKLKIKDLKFN